MPNPLKGILRVDLRKRELVFSSSGSKVGEVGEGGSMMEVDNDQRDALGCEESSASRCAK